MVESIINQVENMSEVGKLEGYNGNILRLGKLILHDYLIVYEGKGIKKGKERYVFLFEQAMILSEIITNKRRKSEILKYIYKNHIKVSLTFRLLARIQGRTCKLIHYLPFLVYPFSVIRFCLLNVIFFDCF